MTCRRTAAFVVCVVLLGVTAAACGGGSTSKDTGALQTIAVPDSITVTSPAFTNGAAIPRATSCAGTGGPPTIRWTSVPARTKSVAVVVDDPDAAGGTFLHWLVIGLAAAPEMLTAYARCFSGADDATLVVAGEDFEPLAAALDAAGLNGEDGPDLLAVELSEGLAGAVRAVYSREPQTGALASVPRVDDGRVAVLRELAADARAVHSL